MNIQNVKLKIREILPNSALEMFYLVKHCYLQKKMTSFDEYLAGFAGKSGVEIGGPSLVFKHYFPIYKQIKALDGVNFSNQTHWEGYITEGNTYKFFKNKTGYQYISDGTELSQIDDKKYDFLLSSHCLEHIANPLKALKEWHRILKDDGALFLILPNKIGNFDRHRPITTFEHILEDYNAQMTEDDLTHIEEVIALTDFVQNMSETEKEDFRQQCLDNFNNRYLHHHVFDLALMQKMMDFIGFECIQKDENTYNLCLLARKKVG